MAVTIHYQDKEMITFPGLSYVQHYTNRCFVEADLPATARLSPYTLIFKLYSNSLLIFSLNLLMRSSVLFRIKTINFQNTAGLIVISTEIT